MRRRTLPVALCLLLVLSAVPVTAAEPQPAPPADQAVPTADPASSGSADPSSAPSGEPSSAPSADPPAPAGDASPSLEPAASAPSEAPGPGGPAATPEPTTVVPPQPSATAPGGLDATGRWIVVLDPRVSPARVRDRHAARTSLRADRLFQGAFRGFAGRLSNRQLAALRADPDVAAVVPDEIVELASQLVPTGVTRSGARASTSTVARINGIDERVDADVAIVDTGIDPNHPDLNVVGGVNCSTADKSLWRDVQGHGTHVAGTVGAIDNASGVVGVAPGVRLWAVKILNDEGFGLLSWYICGLDWITAQRDPNDPDRPLIEAVNMSVAKWGKDGGNCGLTTNDLLHQAICRTTSSGVTVVAAAANDSGSAAARVPAAYNEVITVSALADGDGKGGGLRGTFSCNNGSLDQDDTFGNFSNYGSDVDIIAPGKCIWSTLPGNRYGWSTGTSMAAPAVTGAVALFKASRPWALPGAAKSALQVLGSTNWFMSTDPDSTHERLLDVSKLGPAGSFSVALGAPGALGESGGVATIPVSILRSATHFEALKLTAVAPSGFVVTFDRTTLSGFAGKAATLKVTVPALTPAGSYAVTVVADEGSRKREATVQVVVENDAPVAKPPIAAPAYRYALSTAGAPLRVAWPAATDASSTIAGYEVQTSVSGGPWSASKAYSGTTTAALWYGKLGAGHRFRVRARDAAGNWSDWATGPSLPLGVVDDRATAVHWSSAWYRVSTTWAHRGTLTRSTANGARMDVRVNARTIALVAPTGPTSGWLRIYVDGVYQGQISLYSAKAATRKVLWVKTFAVGGHKLLELRSVRTQTRYRTDLDAILITG